MSQHFYEVEAIIDKRRRQGNLLLREDCSSTKSNGKTTLMINLLGSPSHIWERSST